MTTKTKQTILAILVGVAILAGLVAVENRREANRQAYARAHNCTWYITGTMYGDDRDLICK